MVGRIGVTNTELMVKSRNTLSDVLKPWILHVEIPNGALSHEAADNCVEQNSAVRLVNQIV
jgi:hypothetical protein